MIELSDAIDKIINEYPQALKTALHDAINAHIQSTLEKMNVVTREEFDIQTRVLQRTRERIEALEKSFAEKKL